MPAPFVVRSSYPNLFGPTHNYAIIANSLISSATNVTITNSEKYGSSGTVTGTYTGGVRDDANIASTGPNLINLKAIITSLPPNVTGLPPGLTINLNPGVYHLTSPFLPNVTLNFNAIGDSTAQFVIRSTSSIIFTNVTMNLLNGATSDNIYWYAPLNITFTGTPNIYGTFIANTADITVYSAATINGNLFAATAVTFAANTTLSDATVCYLKGTNILTQNGYTPIEDLNVGDKVFTNGTIDRYNEIDLDNEFFLSPITWINHFKAPNKTQLSLPICFQPHSLGKNCPSETLYVSPLHRIFIRGKMVEAKELVNHSTIFQEDSHEELEYYHFELKTHSCVVANGVLSESYFDSNTKHVFQPISSIATSTLISA